jgi:hypothetical protein
VRDDPTCDHESATRTERGIDETTAIAFLVEDFLTRCDIPHAQTPDLLGLSVHVDPIV